MSYNGGYGAPPPGQYYPVLQQQPQGYGHQQQFPAVGAQYGHQHPPQKGGHHPALGWHSHIRHHVPLHLTNSVVHSQGALALVPSMVTPHEQHLTIKIDGTKKVKDASGNEMLRIKEHSWSSKTGKPDSCAAPGHGRSSESLSSPADDALDYFTTSGQFLFTVKSHCSSSSTFEFETASGHTLLNVSRKGFLKKKHEAHFRNALPPHEDVTLELQSKGQKAFGATRNGHIIVGAQRKAHLLHATVLEITVQPGTDIALVSRSRVVFAKEKS